MKTAVIFLSVLLLTGCFGGGPQEQQQEEKPTGDLPDSFDLEVGVGSMPTLPESPEGLDVPETYTIEEPDFGSII
jgi:hypothetical protein